MNVTQIKIKQKFAERTLRILKENSGLKTIELFKKVYQRSPMYHMDKVGHNLAISWEYEIFRPLLEQKLIVPVGGFGNGYKIGDPQ